MICLLFVPAQMPVPAQASIHGSAATAFVLNSQRNVLNMDFVANYDYAFINALYQNEFSVSPSGAAFAATTSTFNQLIDANGWPNNSGASGHNFGGAFTIPSSSNFAGPWIATWVGDGTLSLSGATCTETNNTGTTYTRNSNCNWTNVAGQTAKVVLNLSAVTNQTKLTWIVSCTGTTCNSGSTGFLKNVKFYRQADETDLLAGKIFRTAFKQYIVNHDPSFLRFMNWHGGNNNQDMRWENRMLPGNAGLSAPQNWTASPPYGAATGTNAYAVAAVSTGGNQTPASMVNGEVATVRFTNACHGSGSTALSAIQNQNIPQVTTTGAIPASWVPGDTIVFRQNGQTPVGIMLKLNYLPVTINTIIDSTHFTINVDTTTFGTITGGSTISIDQFITLQVGSGNDRTAYPVMFLDGTTLACHFSTDIAAGGHYSMAFNKNISAQTDGAGNYLAGAWVWSDQAGGLNGGTPVEICVALVNEVNTLAVSQGVTHPIGMWLNMPVMGLASIDPDYQLSSNYAVQATNVALNGDTVGGVTYAGLTASAPLLVQYSNEIWNQAGCGSFCQTAFLKWQGYLKWKGAGISYSDITDMATYRSTIMARDIRANISSSRLFITLGGQGAGGFAATGNNHGMVYGSAISGNAGFYYSTDATVVAQGWGTPISNHDAFNTASYFDPPNTYYSVTTGTGTFTDDSAMYNGTDNSGNGGGNYTGAANTAQAITNFVAQVNGTSSCAAQSIQCYAQTLRPAYASGLPLGKPSIEYEGGADWVVKAGAATFGPTLTTAMAAFSVAVINSSQWATAQTGYFNSVAAIANAASPSVYIFIAGTSTAPPGDQRWGYASPDSYASGTEGQALLNNPFWVAAGVRNQGLN